jgi:hypothetical protein
MLSLTSSTSGSPPSVIGVSPNIYPAAAVHENVPSPISVLRASKASCISVKRSASILVFVVGSSSVKVVRVMP